MPRKRLDIEFAFGTPSGGLIFVRAHCLSAALAKPAFSLFADRIKLGKDVAMRVAQSDTGGISEEWLRWWIVFESTDVSYAFDAWQYPGKERLPSRNWLEAAGLWQWPWTAPELYAERLPHHILEAVSAAEAEYSA
jgi:hypothetical protein